MDDNSLYSQKIDELAAQLRELELAYERYLSGEEKREPLQQRTRFEAALRKLLVRKATRTENRFRIETLSGRYHTYATHWNRIQRLMDEGKYQRHLARRNGPMPQQAPPQDNNGADHLYDALLKAHRNCNIAGAPPDRKQFSSFLEKQKHQIRERYGKREVEFRVVVENGKPKLRAKAKN